MDDVLPVESTETQAGDTTASTTTTTRPTLTEAPVDKGDVMEVTMDPQRPVSRSEKETYPKPKLKPQIPFLAEGSRLTALPPESLARISTFSFEHNPVYPESASGPSSKVQVVSEMQSPSQTVSMPVDHTAYSQPHPPLSHAPVHTEPPPSTSVTAGTDRTMLTPIYLPSVDENDMHSDSLTRSSSHPVVDSDIAQPTCTSSVEVSIAPHHAPAVDSVDDSQPTKSADHSPPPGSECDSSKGASIKLAWKAALAMRSATKEEPESISQSGSETDVEECSEEQTEPEPDHTGMVHVWCA